jgi:hypothetical protein
MGEASRRLAPTQTEAVASHAVLQAISALAPRWRERWPGVSDEALMELNKARVRSDALTEIG